MTRICEAQDLLEEGESGEEIMVCLYEALDALESIFQEITHYQPR